MGVERALCGPRIAQAVSCRPCFCSFAQVSLSVSVRLNTERARRGVGIGAEVAEALELHGLADRQVGERRLHEAAREHRLGVRVHVLEEVARRRPRGTGS